MKHTLTDADRLELKSKIRDRFAFETTHVGHAVIDTAIEVFAEFLESRRTFSEAIISDDDEEDEESGKLYSELREVRVFAHPFTMNKGMVSMFCMFVEDYQVNKKAMTPKEMRGTHSQKSNFATMRHYGIIDSVSKGEGWFPTEKGMRFFHGEESITMPVFHMADETLPETHVVYERCKKRVTKFIHEIDETRYVQVKEWQDAMRGESSLF